MRVPHLLYTCARTWNRSKKETLRLHKLNKPIQQPAKDNLPNISSHSEDESEWSSSIGSDDFEEGSSQAGAREEFSEDSDVEMPYETVPRPRRPSWDEHPDGEVQRLPIKLSDGQVKSVGVKLRRAREELSEESDEETIDDPAPEPREDATLGRRFGRHSIVDVVTIESRKERIHAAKEQIAGICQEIVGDPEDSVRHLYFVRIIAFNPAASASPASSPAQFQPRNNRISHPIATYP